MLSLYSINVANLDHKIDYIVIIIDYFRKKHNPLKSIIIDYNGLLSKHFLQNHLQNCNISALLTAYSQSKLNRIKPLPNLPPSVFAQTPSPDSLTFIPTPTPMFVKVTSNPPPQVTVPTSLLTIFNGDGVGSLLGCSGYPPAHIKGGRMVVVVNWQRGGGGLWGV